ncbi:alkaline phosphatase family protein [Paludisphaera rhizosphaerae]|uniref:alkaline phosphatase family protein n=1 Tax=Paludisphaera rhizosphaerae TaxID=2711216 RepID=UPI0013EC72B8|nr:alkaline phosphatase family protein [Paludisphaera rhizosphaerae]
MKVMVLGLDGATWDILGPLAADGLLPNIERLRARGASGELQSVFPPLSPVAWTGVMTGKNSGKHGVFEFLEHDHDPMHGRVNSSRAIRADLIWEILARHGKQTIAGGVPMSYPPRPAKDFPGFYLGDFLSPENAPDFTTDPELFAELEKAVGPYRAWSTSIHDGDNEEAVVDDLTAFLDQHLKTIAFLMERRPWDLLMFDLMATDRFGHELWHAWDTAHASAKGRETKLAALKPKLLEFWKTLDRGIGKILDEAGDDVTFLLMSDHGFGPIEHYVNFNVWLLEKGYIVLKDNFYVRQKHWFYRRGVTPQWIYGIMSKLGMAGHRVSRFRGKQESALDRLGEKVFLSREHIDWSRTRAYAQGNFGQLFLNLKGRQPQGCVDPKDARALLDEIKAGLMTIPDPKTGESLVEHVHEAADLYHGPYADKAPDLTVVLKDWKYRTIGLHDFTTHKVIAPAFGPTGDHRMEGVLIAGGPGIQQGTAPSGANLLDIAPTVLHLLGVPVPADMDGRVLDEVLTPDLAATAHQRDDNGDGSTAGVASSYDEEDEAAIQSRLADLGYL